MNPKLFNLGIGLKLKSVTPEILAMPESQDHNGKPVQSVCLNINNLFNFSVLLLQKGVARAPSVS